MENANCKVCGVVKEVFGLETKVSGGREYNTQKFSVEFEDRRHNARYVTMALKDQKINEFRRLVENSFFERKEITCWVDISDYRSTNYLACNCYRIKEGNHLQEENTVSNYDKNAPIVAIRTNNISEELPAQDDFSGIF